MRLPAWHGHPRTPIGGVASDHDRACDIEAPLGPLAVGAGYGVVLGDEPLGTTWFPDSEHRGGMIVRWRYAPDRAAVIAALARLPGAIRGAAAFSFPSRPGKPRFSTAPVPVTLALAPGACRPETADYTPADELALPLHRLTRAGQSP